MKDKTFKAGFYMNVTVLKLTSEQKNRPIAWRTEEGCRLVVHKDRTQHRQEFRFHPIRIITLKLS